jgi:hypothetical protein
LRAQALQRLDGATVYVVQKLQAINYPRTKRLDLLMAFTRVAVSHLDSMLYLARTTNADPTVTALLRLVVETCMRGLWIYYVAPEGAVDAFFDTEKVFPRLWEDLLESLRPFVAGEFLDYASGSWTNYCGYTHSGARQIAMNFDGRGQLVDRYDDGFIVTALWLGTAAFATYAQSVCVICGHPGMAEDIATHRGLWGTPEEFGFGIDHRSSRGVPT